jgi:flagellar motor switch/type III secretory pathway protein FliN
MPMLSVLNNVSRTKTADVLVPRLMQWSKSFFIETPEIAISFNDDFFSTQTVSKNDAVFAVENGFLMIENYEEISNNLIQKALVLEKNITQDEDDDFWKEITVMFNSSFLDCLLGQEKNAEKITSSKTQTEIKPACCITLQFAELTMFVFADVELLVFMGLYVPSKNKTSNQMLSSRKLAVANENVKLKVKLQAVSVPLQDLLELKVGDLIKLEHSLEQPILLETEDSNVPIKAFLVKKDNKKALLLRR